MSDTLIERLRQLDEARDPKTDKHRRVITLIHACIMAGIDTGAEIVAVLTKLGFNRQHVGIVLRAEAGPFPVSHHWYKDDDGRYRSHPLK